MNRESSAVRRCFVTLLCIVSIGPVGSALAQVSGDPCEELQPGDSLEQTSRVKGSFTVDFQGIGDVEPDFALSGLMTTKVTRVANGTFQTEILSMSLSGDHPSLGKVDLGLRGDVPSVGQMTDALVVDNPDTGEPECVVDSFFDVFFELTVEGGDARVPALRNVRPLRMASREPVPIRHGRSFELVQQGAGVDLVDRNGEVVGVLANARQVIEPTTRFKRGDANCDGCVDDLDAAYIDAFLFQDGPPPCCLDAADANDDGVVGDEDSEFILAYVGRGGEAPPAPGPVECGRDPSSDELPEGDYPERLCERECEPAACDLREVRCDLIGGADSPAVAVFWELPPDGCECDRIIIRTLDAAGNVVDEEVVAGAESFHTITIERWEELCASQRGDALDLTVCVTCLKDDVELKPSCCEVQLPCPPNPCPPVRVSCAIDANGNPTVDVVADPNCEGCERLLVTRTDPFGSTQAFMLEGGSTSFTDTTITDDILRELCTELSEARSVRLEYCVSCVNGDAVSEAACCEVELPCPQNDCDVFNVSCDLIQGTNLVQASWELPERCDCEAIRVTCFVGGARVDLATLPGTATAYRCAIPEATLQELCANDRDGLLEVEVCVQCLSPGFTSKPRCCTARVPCPPTPCDIARVVCDPILGTNQVAVVWELPPDGCECDRIIIRTLDVAGNVVDEEMVAGAESFHTIAIERWEELCAAQRGDALDLTVCVTCLKNDVETKPSCCEVQLPCPPAPCPVGEVRCVLDPDLPGVGQVFWQLPADCSCEEVLIRCTAEDGSVVGEVALPAGTPAPFAFAVPLEQLCDGDLDGEITIRCCVRCRVGDELGETACCSLTFRCPPTPCEVEIGRCAFDEETGELSVNWLTPDDCDCDRFRVRCLGESGNIVDELFVDGGATSFTRQLTDDFLRPLCLNDTDGFINLRYCVQCLVGEEASKPACCEVRVPCPTDPCDIQEIRCAFDPATGLAVVNWQLPDDPRCDCESIIVTRVHEGGSEVSFALPGDANSFREEIPVEDLCAEDDDRIIKISYCVRCMHDSAATKPVCCELEIPCPGCDVEIEQCRSGTDSGGNDIIVVDWSVTEGCCESFRIEVNGAAVASVPAEMRTARIPCPGAGIHTICIRCVQPDGTLTRPVCCEVECPERDCGVESVVCDVVGDGPEVVVSWTTPGCDCDGFILRCRSATGRLLFETNLPGDTSTFTHVVPEDVRERLCNESDLGLISLHYCVTCVRNDVIGQPVCCDLRVPCPTVNRLLMCDVNGDGRFDLADAVSLLGVLFLGSEQPCGFSEVADANGDGAVDIADAIYKLSFLFIGGPAPVTPSGQRCIEADCPDSCPL